MTVKDRVGRPRHVVFRVEGGGMSRRDVEAELAAALPDARLTRFDGAHGVVRVPHTRSRAAREALAATARLVPLGTSGTLKAAVTKYAPSLSRAARPRRAPRERASDRAL